MAKVEQDIEVEIDIPKSLKFKKTIGKIKYKLHEEEVKLIIDIKKIGKQIERLQEQLNEANAVIKDYDGFAAELTPDGKYACKYPNSAHLYLEKWGVK